MNQQEIQNLRQDYSASTLSENSTKGDPIKQFEQWFNEALEAKLHEPNAMTLSTATINGKPSARIVLLKGFHTGGFIFFTNYLSRKGKEIAKNPQGALTFFWGGLERQVRIEGTIEKVSKEESEKYFHSRPKGSQVGAVVSPQSQEIESRELLEQKWNELEAEYADKEVPKPSYWGGYILNPQLVEFWQGRPSRMHDRILYKKTDKKTWKKVRLAP
ncbi:pyridoxamine 5'-phosphate oxidase [Mucilaginibacter sp. cycad4]|uniref:Pyridoxine/pyridoxamine 5'-phosphate oxidase n=1 Tax=Mucilaginibacter gossypiicola TaxID=551995 RepID=A0A1H8GCY2_9SPHI|nr:MULTISPECIES: pyridoxamine 5'-phosphate oxidase [Mucilaginibacter]WPV02521.1 pyridoxamine 5'-phosphate oxidase [Mucilaginibacter gossypii]SEN41615.1 Pyridoxamine 5'-phosphate oxidase [Mucilaginibacter gossypiicola]